MPCHYVNFKDKLMVLYSIYTTPAECALPSCFEPDQHFFLSTSHIIGPRPQTPPNPTTLSLAHTLNQLSVSPKKHKQKKRKTSSTKVIPSVFAPKFQLARVKASVSARKGEDDARKADFTSNKRVRVLLPYTIYCFYLEGVAETSLR